MFYRIRIDLAFEKEASINAISKTAHDHLKKAIIINEDQENEERGYIILERCFHDEDPALPCEITEDWLVPLA